MGGMAEAAPPEAAAQATSPRALGLQRQAHQQRQRILPEPSSCRPQQTCCLWVSLHLVLFNNLKVDITFAFDLFCIFKTMQIFYQKL